MKIRKKPSTTWPYACLAASRSREMRFAGVMSATDTTAGRAIPKADLAATG
jgi:hypothetical protein